jgi:hypothetical protein
VLREENVPIRERLFQPEGAASPTALAKVRAGLPDKWPDSARCLFASFTYADLPLGKRFDFAFPKDRPGDAEETVAIVVAITQQYARPFEDVPHGWGTICVIDFPKGIPKAISQMQIVNDWHESELRAVLCSRETMEALISDP